MSILLGATWLVIVLSCLILTGEGRHDQAP